MHEQNTYKIIEGNSKAQTFKQDLQKKITSYQNILKKSKIDRASKSKERIESQRREPLQSRVIHAEPSKAIESRNYYKNQLDNAKSIREKLKNLNEKKENARVASRSKSPISVSRQSNSGYEKKINYLNNAKKTFGLHSKGKSTLQFDSSSSSDEC